MAARLTSIDRGCGDCHDIWIDPQNPDRWVETGDGGMGITTDHGKTFTQIALPIAQKYHVAVDKQVPYWVYSNRQDNWTMRGRSDMVERSGKRPWERAGRQLPPLSRTRGVAAGSAAVARRQHIPWEHDIGGCESGFTLPDLDDPDIVWASCYGNEVTRYDARTKRARSVSPWMHTLDSPPNKLKYRCHWTPPLAIDPFDHNTVYYGCQVIFATSNGGQSWNVISPDLSTQDPSRDRLVRRHRRRQSRAVLRRGGVRDRAVGDSARADLGRHERRADLVHARRRRELERRDEEHRGHAGVGHGSQDRAVALRSRRRHTSPSTCT